MAIGDLTIVTRSLRARLFSTLVTAAMVAVAVALLVTLLSLRAAGERAFERGVGNMHLLVTNEPSPLESVLNGIFYANAPRDFITFEQYEALRSSFPLEFAVPNAQGDSFFGRPVLATTRDFFTAYRPEEDRAWRAARGRFFEAPFEVVAGADAAAAAGIAPGARLYLTHGAPGEPEAHEHRDFRFEVVGVLEPTGTPHDRALFIDLTSTWILHAHDRRTRELGPGAGATTEADLLPADRKITGVYVRVLGRPGQGTGAAVPGVARQIQTRLGLTTVIPGEQIRRLFGIVGGLDQLFVAMGAVVLVSGAVSIMLAIYNQMEHRRRQIAVFRVLGASRGRVFGLVLTESALIGALGAAGGVLLGWFGMQIASSALASRLGLHIEGEVRPDAALVILAAAVVLCAFAGLVPAVAGYRTSVVRNLRPAA